MNELGFDKPPAETRVVVAMSGGVDSSVTAALMKEAGYEVVGITLQLYDHGAAVEKKGACCAGQDIYDARRVAETLDIPHYVLDYESRFREAVMEDFAESYLRGETPIPCVRCNQSVKFHDLLGQARALGADALATGHYVRREAGADGRGQLLRAVDDSRDQSYFLFATTQAQLDFLRFPLGGLPKRETRALAERFALPVAAKPDSQDICFVPNGSYARVVERLRPGALDAGEIVDLEGRVLGRHEGIINYTIGQRRGLGIGGVEEPLYVVHLEPEARRVVVGPHAALARDVVRVGELNWLDGAVLSAAPRRVSVKLRNTQAPVDAEVVAAGDSGAEIRLPAPQHGVSPGQAAVFYQGDRVLGGGWIAAAELRRAA
ncbi:MAG: tRNA 2-thiouridine(34) synthase MnmA [Rhodovibrionaceae bacterium]